jgi:inhibitor of cysteine peptidase
MDRDFLGRLNSIDVMEVTSMKTKIMLVSFLAVVSVFLFGCFQTTQPSELEFMQDATSELTCEMFQEQPHHSGDIVLGVDGTLTVILCSNPTTGFRWLESPEISDTTILRQLDHEFVPPEDENIVGGAGKEIFTFRTLKKGMSTIDFEYSRPWEGGEKGEWTFELEVHVRERS